MADIPIDEKALQADIDEVRTRFTDTKELYKWVCSLLFFRYGITPTTNRLYQLVRKGSMQTVTTALSTFWQDLRERSRIKIDHPGVPDSLIEATGDMVQALWEKANVEARSQFDAALAEGRENVALAESKAADALAVVTRLRSDLAALETQLRTVAAEKSDLNAMYETERRDHSATVATLEASRREVAILRAEVANARRDFAAELEKVRGALELAEERLAAGENRALLEIDRERTARAEAEKSLQRLRGEMSTSERIAHGRLEAQAADIGELRGQLQAAKVHDSEREKDLAKLRSLAIEWEATAARKDGELNSLRAQFEQLQSSRDENAHVVLDELKRAISMEVVARFSMEDIRSRSRANLARWKENGTWGAVYDEWSELLALEDAALIRVMMGTDDRSNRLRQSIPYVGLLPTEIVAQLRKRIQGWHMTPENNELSS